MVFNLKPFPPLVLHVIYRLGIGGLENGLINLINRMPPDCYRHAIICLTDSTDFSKRIQRHDVEIFEIHKSPGQDWGSFIRVFRLIKQLKPAIVHTRNLAAIEYQSCALLAGVPYRVHSEHGWDVFDPDGNNVKYQWLRRLFGIMIHRFIALSQQLQDYLQIKVGIRADKISRICNGVDTKVFYPASESKLIPDGCPIPITGKIVIGTVGRMHGVKDQMTLVHAFIIACQQSTDFAKRVCLYMIGDGPLREQANELLFSHGLNEQCWLPGERQDIAEILRGLDIFVLPSKSEGISNTILEAMASGLPVIATNVGGNPELVVHGQTGYLVDKESPSALASALLELVSHDYTREQFAQAALLRVKQHFSIDSMVERYQTVYDMQ